MTTTNLQKKILKEPQIKISTTIKIAKFDKVKLRKLLLSALFKINKTDISKEALDTICSSFKDFRSELYREYNKSIHREDGHDQDPFYDTNYSTEYDEEAYVAENTCCGVSEIGNLPKNFKSVVFSISRIMLNDAPTYFRYFDNIIEARAKQNISNLQKLGWKCTGFFVNNNMHRKNIELTADYGGSLSEKE